jgi:hypothetical protein
MPNCQINKKIKKIKVSKADEDATKLKYIEFQT